MPMMGAGRPMADFGMHNPTLLAQNATDNANQTLVWLACRNTVIQSATMIKFVLTQAQICRTSTPTSAISQDQVKRNKCCKQSAEWLHSENVSCATTTRSSNTTEVGPEAQRDSHTFWLTNRCFGRHIYTREVRPCNQPQHNE